MCANRSHVLPPPAGGDEPLRILFVSPLFPPENTISAVRIGRFAAHLAEAGHSVRVLARVAVAGGLDEPDYSRMDLQVVRVKDPMAVVERLVKPKVSSRARGRSPRTGLRNSGIFHRFKRVMSSTLLWPDRFIGWALLASLLGPIPIWRPQVIVASAPPFSAMLLGAWLAKRYGVPWVADYRDLLAFGPYNESGRIRNRLERFAEYRITRTAWAILTVSAPLAEDLEAIFHRPVDVVMNGYDSEDFSNEAGTRSVSAASDELTITYCGEIYHGKRDPGPLFEALAALRDEGTRVRVRFFGNSVGMIESLAARHGVLEMVDTSPRVPRAESLALQSESDALLMLMWNDPRERGVFSGKLFEYIGSGRPILMLGYEGGVAAELIKSRGAGFVSNDAHGIADIIRCWAKVRSRGLIPRVAPEARLGLSRREQASRLETVIRRVVKG